MMCCLDGEYTELARRTITTTTVGGVSLGLDFPDWGNSEKVLTPLL